LENDDMRPITSKRLLAFCSALLWAAYAVPAVAADASLGGKPELTMSTGFDYSTGDYGQTESTQIIDVPVTAKLKYQGWTGKVTVPYLSITGPGVVVGSDGIPVGTPGPKTTESGLGDVTTSLAYATTVLSSDTTATFLGKVKIPTADKNRNLGTGEFDYTLQAGLTQNIGNFYLSGSGGRKFNGTSAQFPLRDVWKYSLSGGWIISPVTAAGIGYDYRERETVSPAGSNASEAMAFLSHNFDGNWAAQAYTLAGFTNGSPDWGVGLTISYKMDPLDFILDHSAVR
jgi:hypothetical protein